MTSALVGYTGFVGGNLARQVRFDEFYNSKNIEDIRGRRLDEVICAGMPGAKWYANQNPQEDLGSLLRLRAALREVKTRRLVIVSTIDAIDPQDAYGIHRRALEDMIQDALIIRLPALFGQNLRKNALYDLMVAQDLNKIAPNAIYQWYPLRRIAADLGRIHCRVTNFLSEPIAMEEIRARFFPRLTIGPARPDAPRYNFPCDDPDFWLTKAEIMDELGNFLAGRA